MATNDSTKKNVQAINTEEKQYDERTLHIDRVARVVKGGRRFRFRALVVVGDKKGKVGVGTAKGADVTSAITKATDVAKKNMVKVSLYKGTLPVAGVKNALSKSLGSSNKTNIAYATIQALDNLVPAKEWITVSAKPKSTKKA